ncbi:MAG: ADP-forming succinate--CoA ligase subunit beta [Dehalococcoidales bacterium]
MKLFEFEAKRILSDYGIRIPESAVATNPEEAEAIAREIAKPVALKSQVLVSGRGKAGGIVFASAATEAKNLAASLIGSSIKGNVVSRLLVEEKLNMTEQFYASIAVDRQAKAYVVLASTSGGIDIEEIALATPDRITRHWIDPLTGFSEQDALEIVSRLNTSQDDAKKLASIMKVLYQVTMDYDAELVEINPLAKTPASEFMAADARIILDDNALFRHPEFREREMERAEGTSREAEALKLKLTYIDLDGDIGIIGNGAGLTMATLDLVHLFGGKPANFLDIGGGARVETIKKAVMLVMSKPEVRAVMINILGGITRCDLVARGIIEGLNESAIKKPIAARLMGTNEEEGTQILHQAGVHIYLSMEEAIRGALKL